MEKILQGFLWVGRREANDGHCHVNWQKVCRPLDLGGLGIPNLSRTATSLRICWLWCLLTDTGRPWRGLDMQFIRNERSVFVVLVASTNMVLGDGTDALFWVDRWLLS